MREPTCQTDGDAPLVGATLAAPSTAIAMAWSGMLFDLSIVPLLLWKKTRAAAYVVCVLFHVTNSVLFPIHVFPWFMIFASTIFFEPGWPRRVLGGQSRDLPTPHPRDWLTLSRQAHV